jgi:iron complex transport system substrate-binding protein
MKTEIKILASLEIAIVLCSVFLVATLPAIAAEQTSQKVSASTITTASEDDYVLGVYGNANEDDTIDMRDLTYVKLIFFGKKPETKLADAKYDGKINPLDFIQIKLIIVGKEKELTIVDSADRIVTVKKPIKRITLAYYDAEVIRIFEAKDKIVGVSSTLKAREVYFPELSKLPSTGSLFDPDYEAIISLNPDLVITWTRYAATHDEKLLGSTAVVGLDFVVPPNMKEEVMKLGYILGKKDGAKYYIADFHDKYIDPIKARTKKLSEEERPKVYLERRSPKGYFTYTGDNPHFQPIIDIAGGKNIFADLEGSHVYVDPEEVVVRNPDIIIRDTYITDIKCGYQADDPSEMKTLRESIMNRPELANVNSVKTGRVYITTVVLPKGPGYPISAAYWAKWFHPDLFKDIDPKAAHQEYLTRFQGLDYDLDKHGVFVYPEEPV